MTETATAQEITADEAEDAAKDAAEDAELAGEESPLDHAPDELGPGVTLVPAGQGPAAPEQPRLNPFGVPLMPTTEELNNLAHLACTFAFANLVPRALQGRPNDVLLVMLTGRNLGLDPTTSVQILYPIDGKVTVPPKVKAALVNVVSRRQSLGWNHWPDPNNNAAGATWYATRPDKPGITYSWTFTREDAERITFKDKDGKTKKLADKDNHKNYPANMVNWRALGSVLDFAFPEVTLGLYSPDEMGAITNEDGEIVHDVIEVGAYEGMIGPGRAKAGEAWADKEAVKALYERACALPEGAREHMKTAWDTWDFPTKENGKAAWNLLTISMVPGVRSIVEKIEARAKAGEWGEWTPPAGVEEGGPGGTGRVITDPGGGKGEGFGEVPLAQAPAGQAKCSHPWPPEWHQDENKNVTCPTCNRAIYQGDLPENPEQAAAVAIWLDSPDAAALDAGRAQAQAALQPGMCMHPDAQNVDEDPITGRKVWLCCGEPAP